LLGILIASPASAATLSGFVTSIPGTGSFEMGKTRVIMNGSTVCFARPDSHFELKSPGILSRRTLWKHGTKIGCEDLAPAMGSQIDVWGQFTSADTFAADAVVIHRPGRPEMLEGAALLEEPPSIQRSGNKFAGQVWIDGYPIRIVPDSTMLTAPAGTDLRYHLHGFWHNLLIDARIRRRAIAPPFSVDLLRPGAWTTYHGTATPDGRVTASQVRVWSDKESPREKQFIQEFEPVITPPDYSRHIDGKVEFSSAPAISIVADANVQQWVSALGESLVPECWRAAQCSLGAGRQLRFLVVREFPARLGTYFVVEGLDLPVDQLLRWSRKSRGLYVRPRPGSMVKQVVVVPDGTILVPDSALANLRNKAQLAASLSFAITSVVQHHAYHMSHHYLKPERDSQLDVIVLPYKLWEYGQLVRLGVRQMYLAGFDIREAPSSIASGSTARNPLVDFKSCDAVIGMYKPVASSRANGLALFPTYAFNYISQYYSNVDYSKLKRGRAEYATFLKELRKADPDAFVKDRGIVGGTPF
jgi:hypothetical protein